MTARIAARRVTYLLVSASLCLTAMDCLAIGQARYVEFSPGEGSFPIVQGGNVANVYVDAQDWPGVVRAANDLQADVERVTNLKPAVTHDAKSPGKHAIIIGTVGKSAVIDQLIRDQKVDVSRITGRWEASLIQVIEKPLPGVDSAVVIAGSDKRGAIFAIYDLSEQIGVSPWYWWADVPVEKARRYLRQSRSPCSRSARREVSRHLSQRRSPGALGLGAGKVRRHEPQVLHEHLRVDSAPEG